MEKRGHLVGTHSPSLPSTSKLSFLIIQHKLPFLGWKDRRENYSLSKYTTHPPQVLKYFLCEKKVHIRIRKWSISNPVLHSTLLSRPLVLPQGSHTTDELHRLGRPSLANLSNAAAQPHAITGCFLSLL